MNIEVWEGGSYRFRKLEIILGHMGLRSETSTFHKEMPYHSILNQFKIENKM